MPTGFESAFASARKKGATSFGYNGKVYSTKTVEEKALSDVMKENPGLSKVIDEKNANVVIEKKTENGTEKYIIVDNQAGKAAIKPAFYLDGVKITEKGMKAISPNDIESINVLKGEQAIKKYSEDGKNSKVKIKLKKKN